MNARPVFHCDGLMSYEDGVVSLRRHLIITHFPLTSGCSCQIKGPVTSAPLLTGSSVSPSIPRAPGGRDGISENRYTPAKSRHSTELEDGDAAAARDSRRKIRLAHESRNIARVLWTT